MAGFDKIPEIFGFKTISSQLSGGDLIKEKEILGLSVYEVYNELQLRSWVSKCTKDYEDIVRSKQKK
tara:strand:- start:160 stop:360 length:201 start_codon:yes stop_codon:yes gene_type:complete